MSVWTRSRIAATIYDYGVEREPLARFFGRLLWGADAGRLYSEIARLREITDGESIIDVPCGGGLAFRGLPPGGSYRYAAVDLSPTMLSRARSEAARRRLSGIEFTQASVTELPYEDASFDLCLTYNGLHCFPAPADAVREMARVLRPGGELRGTMVVRGGGFRQDALINLYERVGFFARGGSAADLRSWLDGAGLGDVRVDVDGALAFFSARRDS